MQRIFLLFCLVVIPAITFSQDDWDTYCERSGFTSTPSYQETIGFCEKLDRGSGLISLQSFGKSPQGRDLPLLICDRDGFSDPVSVRKAGRAVMLILAGIHAGEIDGKDAGLMFLRDIAIMNKYTQVLDNVTILFIPILNVDGHERSGPYNRINQDGPEEMGWRTTAQNLNLNRDFLKADTPEMQAWLKLFHQWLPDLFIDIHVTDGADYQYALTYSFETSGNMDRGLAEWAENVVTPRMTMEMDEAEYPIFPYVMFRRWFDPRSGLRNSVATPRYSQGYTSAMNRLGLLVENHSLKNYRTRVLATYELLVVLSRILNDHSDELQSLNRLADEFTSSESFRAQPLTLTYTTGPDSVMVEFRGVEYDVETSDLTGGSWFRYHSDRPKTYLIPYFNQMLPDLTVNLPEAYIIPPEWTEVISKLDHHKIVYNTLTSTERVRVQAFHFRDVSWNKAPYEGRLSFSAEYDVMDEEMDFPAGSVIIPVNQPGARIIAYMFEPGSPDSFLKWGFFNSIFEMKEYFETYVMEEKAREMISADPALLKEFNTAREKDPEFARSQWAQLEWFFLRSAYADKKKDVYPVCRITSRDAMPDLIEKTR